MARVGIFAGTFDPIHDGHLAFAREAMRVCGLNMLVLLPEREPRGKPNVSAIGHRSAMIKLAITGNPALRLMELPQRHFTVMETMFILRQAFPGDDIILLFGSDIAAHIPAWPDGTRLLQETEIIVGLRADDEPPTLLGTITYIQTPHAHVAASQLRTAKSTAAPAPVLAYMAAHRLYRPTTS